MTGFAPVSSYQSSYIVEPLESPFFQRTVNASHSLVQEKYNGSSAPILRSVMAPLLSTNTLQHSKQLPINASVLTKEGLYDDTIPCTQPTDGIPLSTQFYYG